MNFSSGDEVIALIRIEERGFNGPGLHTHACAGDHGKVVSVDEQFVLVLWERTETSSTCHRSELVGSFHRI
jgi:hypothetical protein